MADKIKFTDGNLVVSDNPMTNHSVWLLAETGKNNAHNANRSKESSMAQAKAGKDAGKMVENSYYC